MRNFLLILSLAFMLVGNVDAQTKKTTPAKATQAKPAPKPEAQPVVISTKEPAFAGFTGGFIKFGSMSGNGRQFTMSVEYKPWFFEVSGTANAGHNTADLEILLEDIVAVVAYYDAKGKAADGTDYQAAIFDLMIYFEDAPIAVSNLKFTLIGKAAQSSAVIAQARTWNFEQGQVFKSQKYSKTILRSQAAALDKSDIERELQAEKKRQADSIARVEKRKRDSIAAAQKRVKDSIEEYKAEEARKKAAARKKRVVEEYDEEDDYEPPPRKKTKKRPVVEEDDDDYYEPPPRKKTKKRPVVEEDDDDDYDPPPKKRKKRQ